MATHVVCPLCGKSSSLRAFPSSGGTDLLLQSFRGKGRGRGFEAIPAGSGLSDPRLANAVHAKVAEILRALESRGFPNDATAPTPRHTETDPRARIASLEQELEHERSSRKFFESEVTHLESELARDRQMRLNTLAQVGKLANQLDRAKAMQAELLAASRRCIASLRTLREQLKGVPFAAQTLTPLVHDMKGVVDLVQELRAVSSIASVTATDELATR